MDAYPDKMDEGLDFFERHLRLPGNADAELTIAEYQDGILHLYIPKDGSGTTADTRQRIVVY
jgi:HSP20 family molecular chaperone IbpA